MPGPAPTLVLASASPRRHELLGRLGAPFEVRVADVDETMRAGERPADLVRRLAVDKARAGLAAAPEPDVVVVGADTVVTIDLEVLGKPVDGADAARMLRRLSGRTHRVLTGVAVARRRTVAPRSADPAVVVGAATSLDVEVVVTDVVFEDLADADVAWYVATGEPLDKAGAYALQGAGAVLVREVRGSPDNVIGLPLATTRRLLAAAGIDPLR